MATVPLRTLLLLAAATAIGCEANQRSAQSRGSDLPTAPSSLKRVVDDVPSEGSGGQDTTGGCETPPCTPPPPPEPKPQPVTGEFVVSSVDRSTIRGFYITRTTSSGLPENGILGNSGLNVGFPNTDVQGTGRFAGASTAVFSVDFGAGGSTANISLKWSIAQSGVPDGYRSYGDSVTLPYSSQRASDSSCASGYRFTAMISGQMENIGRFTATLNHCVSPVQ